jgi:hypothetical protein
MYQFDAKGFVIFFAADAVGALTSTLAVIPAARLST